MWRPEWEVALELQRVFKWKGSALSPFLFNIVFDVLTRRVRQDMPWSMMYADDVVLCGETSGEVERLLEEWRVALESGGMRISRTKTEYMRCTHHDREREQRVEVRLDGEVIKSVDGFKYLGSTITVDGSEEREVTRRIQAGWKNWREVSGVLCDRRMPVKLKGKVYKRVVWPAMIYGMEATPIKKVKEKRMNVAEIKMLRWMSGVTRRDRIPNTQIKGTAKVAELSKKVQEARERWYGHVLRRDEQGLERWMMDMEVQGRRERGRPKTRWKDCISADVREKQLIKNGNSI